MPPHIMSVFRYQSGKLPLCQASAKLRNPNGPAGVSEAMSAGTPGRSAASAIHANGTIQTSAAALAAASAMRRHSAFIMDPALEQAERQQRQGQQSRNADHGSRGGEPDIVILRRRLLHV